MAFQYPKVRLKVLSAIVADSPEDISIPEGAIKRARACGACLRVEEISIPEGAIKSFRYFLSRRRRRDFNTRRCD